MAHILPPPSLVEAPKVMLRVQCTKGEGNRAQRELRTVSLGDREAGRMLHRRRPVPNPNPLNASPVDLALNPSRPQL